MVDVVLAVVMNITRLRSTGTSRKWSRNEVFCSLSSTSSRADAGSPRMSLPSLSISSSTSSGFMAPARLMASMMRPGIAPM